MSIPDLTGQDRIRGNVIRTTYADTRDFQEEANVYQVQIQNIFLGPRKQDQKTECQRVPAEGERFVTKHSTFLETTYRLATT